MEASSSSKSTMKSPSNSNNSSPPSSSDALNDSVNGPPSGFVLKLYQMVTDAPDDIVSVSIPFFSFSSAHFEATNDYIINTRVCIYFYYFVGYHCNCI